MSLLRRKEWGSDDDEGINLTWRNLSVYAIVDEKAFFSGTKRRHKRILNNLTGVVKAGSLVALMGPSGSGKSTLMATLSNRNPNNIHAEGDIRANGVPIGYYFNKISGYMHQEDLFVNTLTVREHLTIMVWLKLGRNKNSSDVAKIVRDLLSKVGLTGSAEKRIGIDGRESLLSGGEKKKLAFATEMITDPKVLFCDEPTTGLDSYSARSIIQLMKLMALENKTILCTIHQPSSDVFDMFDHLILLVNGRIAFIGDTCEALTHFHTFGYACPSKYNPAEFLIRTVTNDMDDRTINRFCDNFIVSDKAREVENLVCDAEINLGDLQSQNTKKNLLTVSHWNEPMWWTKLLWLTRRSFLQVLRNPAVQIIRILQKLGIAFMAGLCFAGSNPHTQAGIQSVQGAVFLFVTENTFAGMYAMLSLFPKELPLFVRDYKNGLYSCHLFYISTILSLLPGLILEPVLFVVILYWLTGLRKSIFAFSMTLLASVLTMNVATACGSFFSNIFESVTVAMTCLVPFDFMLMSTSGLFINLESLPRGIGWCRYLSWFMYSNEAIMIVQWDGVQNISCEYADPNIPRLRNGTEVLDMFNFSPIHLYNDIIAIFVMCILYHILACLSLWRKVRAK